MWATSRLTYLTVAFLSSWTALVAFGALAQPPSLQTPTDPGIATDDMLTLVVGTRFVAPSANETSARAQFTELRIPLSLFNETDHCVDQNALEMAKEYFATLGRLLGKAGHYYFVPETEIRKLVSMCEKLHARPPQGWVDNETKVIAFGKVVPSTDAHALEKSIW
ncbi:MAG: hypothetical protein ABL907_20135 [Hyphomicrobium sp.]